MSWFRRAASPSWMEKPSPPRSPLSAFDIESVVGGLPPLAPADQVIEFEAGDQLIVQCERRVPRDVFDRLRAQLNDRADDKVIILEAGLKLVGRRKKKEDIA